MLYIVIETFKKGKVKELYSTFELKGRQLPPGVTYINSWIDEEFTTCYQLMSADEIETIIEWTTIWKSFADFQIVPVIPSEEASEKVSKL